MKMTVDEALKIFGLDYNFNAADLKSSYRRLAKQCHPDIVGADSLEKMTMVNNAHDVLQAYLKDKSSYQHAQSTESRPNNNPKTEPYQGQESKKSSSQESTPDFMESEVEIYREVTFKLIKDYLKNIDKLRELELTNIVWNAINKSFSNMQLYIERIKKCFDVLELKKIFGELMDVFNDDLKNIDKELFNVYPMLEKYKPYFIVNLSIYDHIVELTRLKKLQYDIYFYPTKQPIFIKYFMNSKYYELEPKIDEVIYKYVDLIFRNPVKEGDYKMQLMQEVDNLFNLSYGDASNKHF